MGRGPSIKYHQMMNEDYVEGTLTCLTSATIKERINTDFPLVLNIEPTNVCNQSCYYCPRERMVQKNGIHHLPFDTYKRIIDEASEYHQLIMLNLHKDGEPLLHKQLPEMVEYAKNRRVAKTIHLNTNGTLLNTNRGKELLGAGIDDITVSIDAAFPDSYRKLKGSDKLDDLNRDIDSFIEYRDKIGADTFIRVKIMEFDGVGGDEIDAFVNKWTGVADQVQVTGVHNWSGAIEHLKITDEMGTVRYPCALLWYALAVNSNGIVSICNVDWDYSGAVGDIHKSSLHHVWNDLPLRRIRRSHMNAMWKEVSVCGLCAVWTSTDNLEDFFLLHPEFF